MSTSPERDQSWLSLVLHDVHFWVPAPRRTSANHLMAWDSTTGDAAGCRQSGFSAD